MKAEVERSVRRGRVLLPGVIVYGGGTFTCDCTIRDLTVTGARVSIPQSLQFPERFHLINVRHGLVYDARTIWNRDRDIGLKFESVVVLSTNNDAAMARIKNLWLAKAPR